MDSKTTPLTTFVEVDTKTFKDVVQRLTGASEKANMGVKKPAFKLYERRQIKGKFEIIKPSLNFNKQRIRGGIHINRVFQSSSPLTTPTEYFSSLCLVERESTRIDDLNTGEEEKAIKERRFYLHPSPRSKPGFTEPHLLTLFPLTSPNYDTGN